MIVLRDKNFSYVPYEKQEKDKKDRRKLMASGLALTGAGSIAGYKTEVGLGSKKIDKKIGARVEKFNKAAADRESKEIGKAIKNSQNSVKNIENARAAEIEKANKSLLFKKKKVRKANENATKLIKEETGKFKAAVDRAKTVAASDKARYQKVANKVAANSKKLLKKTASNRALGAAFVGTGLTIGATKVLKHKQKKENDNIKG